MTQTWRGDAGHQPDEDVATAGSSPTLATCRTMMWICWGFEIPSPKVCTTDWGRPDPPTFPPGWSAAAADPATPSPALPTGPVDPCAVAFVSSAPVRSGRFLRRGPRAAGDRVRLRHHQRLRPTAAVPAVRTRHRGRRRRLALQIHSRLGLGGRRGRPVLHPGDRGIRIPGTLPVLVGDVGLAPGGVAEGWGGDVRAAEVVLSPGDEAQRTACLSGLRCVTRGTRKESR